MIKSLRQRHLQIWRLLAVILPAGILCAVIAVPKQAADKLLQPGFVKALPVIVKTNDKENYTARLRCSADSTNWQLEWINKTALIFPSALIYKVPSLQSNSEDISGGAVIIGRIASKGAFYFPLKKDTAAQCFLIYDIIHHKKIDSLIF